VKIYKTVTGRVNLIQEQRFRLILDDGRSFLFTLGHNASMDAGALETVKRKHQRVRVAFTGEPDQASGVARTIQPIDSLMRIKT
jgi:hypothetical protein